MPNFAAAAAVWRAWLDWVAPWVMIVSAPWSAASPIRNSSLRVLLPPVARPVQSSRLIQRRGPLRCFDSRSIGSRGVSRWAKRKRGNRERCMSVPALEADFGPGLPWSLETGARAAISLFPSLGYQRGLNLEGPPAPFVAPDGAKGGPELASSKTTGRRRFREPTFAHIEALAAGHRARHPVRDVFPLLRRSHEFRDRRACHEGRPSSQRHRPGNSFCRLRHSLRAASAFGWRGRGQAGTARDARSLRL